MQQGQERSNEEEISNRGSVPVEPESDAPRIVVAICGHESRGVAFNKHTVYLIKGSDKNGAFQVWRRFSQFHQMRQALKKAWPGCFIPGLPGKNPILKNEEQINLKRERFLNDFLKKMSFREYFYYSQQFQTLLHSQEANLNDIFSKWPSPTTQSIILRYKELFPDLAEKEITKDTIEQIFAFHRRLQQNEKKLLQYRKIAKQLAIRRDRYNRIYFQFIYNMRIYEKMIMTNLANPNQLLYTNELHPQMLQHEKQVQDITAANPYWLLYDLIKHQERDARAFLQLLKSIQHYGNLAKELQGKIQNNLKDIVQASAGRKSIRTFTMKGSAEEVKSQLQIQNETLKNQKDATQTLRDIIVAVASFVQIQQYKKTKKQFYHITLQKLTIFQNNFTNVALKIWEEIQQQLWKLLEGTDQ